MTDSGNNVVTVTRPSEKTVNKRIYIVDKGVRVVLDGKRTVEGKQVRLYGSSAVLLNPRTDKMYIDTDNIILIDGVEYL